MLRLKTFGQALCEIGPHRITPAAELQFALLLYLGAHAGKVVPRRRLASVLWGEQAAAQSSHRLRQALYILRKLGLELEVTRDTLLLPADQVDSDFAAFASPATGSADLSVVQGEFLPASHRIFSAEFDSWVESQRRLVGAGVLRQTLAAIRRSRDSGNWNEVMAYAKVGLLFDPLNEEAHLALAEALASTGSKSEALRLLKTYETEIGSLSSDAKVPAARLRERVAAIRETPNRPAFVGRQRELATLTEALLASQSSRTQIVGIVGEAGIGKTSLVSEFLRRQIVSVQSRVSLGAEQFDRDKPFGTILQLVAKLLGLPGAMGSSPQCLADLRNLIGDVPWGNADSVPLAPGELGEHRIAEQIEELLDAICDEEPLTITVEDVHNVDPTSLQLLTSTRMLSGTRRLLIVMTGRDSDSVEQWKEQRGVKILRLAPLTHEDAQCLVSSTGAEITSGQVEEWFTLTGGNPYFLEQLLRGSWSASHSSLPTSISALIHHRIGLLSSLAIRTLQLCALLGRYSTIQRLEALLSEPRTAVISAIEELERHDMVRGTEAGTLQCAHDLLGEGALQRLTATSRQYFHLLTGEQLAREYQASSDPAVAWDAAAHLGDAGKRAEAASLLSACAHEMLRIGLADHAAELLRRALASSTDLSSRVQLTRQLIDIHRRTLQWDEVAALLQSLPHEEQRHDAVHVELALVAIEEALSQLADP
ncbi:MAG: AAA family ATPase, partial [Gemmatimonadetes bacterium]|nr:AAA family ATPase [Gemmatimonadota bacterium]